MGIVGKAFLYLNWFVCVAALIAHPLVAAGNDAAKQCLA
jgi:hypothetical protein